MEEAKLSSKGQLVIPKYMRDAAGLKTGSTVLITTADNRIIIIPKPDDPIKGLVDAGSRMGMKNIRRHIKEE